MSPLNKHRHDFYANYRQFILNRVQRRLNKWCFTRLSTVFHDDSSHYSCLSWVSPVLGWGSDVPCPRTLQQKNQRIQCRSNPGPLDCKSNTLLLSNAGPLPHTNQQEGQKLCRKKILQDRVIKKVLKVSTSSLLHFSARFLA